MSKAEHGNSVDLGGEKDRTECWYALSPGTEVYHPDPMCRHIVKAKRKRKQERWYIEKHLELEECSFCAGTVSEKTVNPWESKACPMCGEPFRRYREHLPECNP